MEAKYITVRKASEKYGFTLNFLRGRIYDDRLDSRKEYVKYKSSHNAKGSYYIRHVVVVNEDQVRGLKRWEPKELPSEAWILQQTRRGFTQEQMAIKYGINEHRLRDRICELGLGRNHIEAGKLRHRKDRPYIEEAEILPAARVPNNRKFKSAETFYDTLDWVDSLDKMPTQEEIEKHAIPGLMSEWLIKSMIETRPYRKLDKLEEE